MSAAMVARIGRQRQRYEDNLRLVSGYVANALFLSATKLTVHKLSISLFDAQRDVTIPSIFCGEE